MTDRYDATSKGMRTLMFYGYNNMPFIIKGRSVNEPDAICHSPAILALKGTNDFMWVTGYKLRGAWSLGVAPDGDLPLPKWPMRIYGQGASTILEIDVPEDVTINRIPKQTTQLIRSSEPKDQQRLLQEALQQLKDTVPLLVDDDECGGVVLHADAGDV